MPARRPYSFRSILCPDAPRAQSQGRSCNQLAPGDKLPKLWHLEIVDIVLVCAALKVYRVYLEKEMKNLDGDDPHAVRLDTDYVHAKELYAILHDALNGRFALIFKRSA